jgi:hypothetical protein
MSNKKTNTFEDEYLEEIIIERTPGVDGWRDNYYPYRDFETNPPRENLESGSRAYLRYS